MRNIFKILRYAQNDALRRIRLRLYKRGAEVIMGFYINAGNENLKMALNSEIFVDKSLVLAKFCRLLNSNQRFICVSRPRRFGKTTVRDLMVAYFSKGCDSYELFKNLKIASEPCFKEKLNKFNVVSIDLGAIFSISRNKNEIISNLYKKLLEDFKEEFPDIKFYDKDSVADLIMKAYKHTKAQFIIIIDEYDVLIRERVNETLLKEYLELLNSLFKNNELSPAIAFAYLTGILPIIRDKVQSKLNVFKESTMLQPFGLEEYFGFTKNEVKALCKEYKMSFKECERWYDGYKIGTLDIYNPNSVVTAMLAHEFANYWQKTGSYEAVSDYIKLDYDGIKSDVVDMLTGKEVFVNVNNFSNLLSEIKTKDDVFTYLVHLGYLNYNKTTKLCRIPNKEIKEEWYSALERADNFTRIVEMIKDSDRLLYYTQRCDIEKVAAALDEAHLAISNPKNYNNEASLQAAIRLAYFTASSKYTIIQELTTGYGFADMGFIPIDKKDPAIIIELKYDKNADTAIKQIKNKKYPAVLENYLDNLLLVGVNYDKETKIHECNIEKYQK